MSEIDSKIDQELYDRFYDEYMETYTQAIEKKLKEPSDYNLKSIVRKVREGLNVELRSLTLKLIENSTNAYDPDDYLRKLVEEFRHRGHDLKGDTVFGFFKNEFPALKERFKDKTINLHGVYSADENDSLKYLARYFSLEEFIKFLSKAEDSNDDSSSFMNDLNSQIRGVPRNLESQSNIEDNRINNEDLKAGSIMQRVILLTYLLDSIGAKKEGGGISARVRLIKFLTDKNETTIRRMLENPWDIYKSPSNLIKDFEIIIPFLKDLELDQIVADTLSDLAEIKQKETIPKK